MSVRRPLVAVSAALGLVVVEAVADPTGLLALAGWSGAAPVLASGIWPFAASLVFVPVLLAVVWWAAVRAGERYWTLAAGVVLAVLLAQATACLVMTGNLAASTWAAGYVTAKAVPTGLIVAAFARWFGGRTTRQRFPSGSPLIPAALFAAIAPFVAGLWWTSAAYAPGVPVARADRGPLSLIVAMLLLALVTALCLRWMRARVPGILGGWLAALVAGGIVGLVQALIAFLVDGGLSGDLWPAMAAYVAIADGLSFGACLGWVAGVAALVVERVPAARRARLPLVTSAAIVVASLVVALVVPVALPETAASASEADSAPAGFLRASGRVITDGRGNQVLLRGVNVNQLVDFYQPRPDVPATRPLTEEDFAQIAAEGFDVVRLNLSWSALEPQRGVFDQKYLARITSAVDWAHRHGVYIVLDMHQDGWWKGATTAGTTCRPGTDPMWGYDGAPAWATISDGAARCEFTGRDISPAGDRAFQNFYFDTDGVQSALVRTWGRLAATFGDDPTVAGYDLLNEPGFGETAPVTTSYLLGRYYDRAIAAIRAAGSRQMVFVEPSILWSGLGFDSGPAPAFTSDHDIVFSPHLYAESITMDRSLGLPPIVGIDRQFTLAQRVADEYNAPVWSGEFGYWGSTSDVDARLTRYAKAEDANRLGSAYWVWKQACGDPQNGIGPTGDGLIPEDCATGQDAAPRDDLLTILGRAYPRSAPGTISSLTSSGANVQLAGATRHRSCGLDVWVPGAKRPIIHSTGLANVKTTPDSGGWTVTGCADGSYSLTAAARVSS
ncbi:cellulase family glycosylhydrolase [Planctomonas sp. JC2975]|uniref:cellulase family glycosylhydrolase n=1 Tax=Planctomonas sp. JC2975 TaxID=2729626 RepID=UPI0014766051|nr:cellulase family glycosylhydrolase [Planctomonas sp. JC2975]NNC10630.1 cellulase family glycosylhydrolase [Planctomonas sp. JC2975]